MTATIRRWEAPDRPLYRLSDVLERATAVHRAEQAYWNRANASTKDEFVQAIDRLAIRLLAMRDALEPREQPVTQFMGEPL
jgi:hypothetical protein